MKDINEPLNENQEMNCMVRINGKRAVVIAKALVGVVGMLASAAPAQEKTAGWSAQPQVQTNAANQTIKYAWYTPTASPDTRYPLVVYLHSNGQGPASLHATSPLLKLLAEPKWQAERPCFIMAPACPQDQVQAKWVNWPWEKGSYSIQSVPISISLQLVMDAIVKVARENPVDTNRIYVAGGSMGGYAVWDSICRFPDRFACAIALSGGGDPSRADAIKKVPVHAFAIATDPIVPVRGSREMIQAIRAAGGEPKYTEFPGGWHLWDQVWDPKNKDYWQKDLMPWAFDQTRDAAAVHVRMEVEGEGTVVADAPGWIYARGKALKLTATPAAGWEFASWSGDAVGKDNPLSITAEKNVAITAIFKKP